ncbi:MAG TPA: hypothetical protein VFX59_23835 [Polyangiales bacterium]|nr:hypothetical protein [Polyangiales bacterium]
MSPRSVRACALSLAALWLTGCPDPGGEFDAFTRRAGTRTTDAGMLSCESAEGELPEPEQLSGQFLLSVSTILGRETPFVYLLDVEVAREDGSYQITMSATPLLASDRKTPAGEASEPQSFTVEPNGCFESPPQTFMVAGPANPILPVPATSELSFLGSVASAVRDDEGRVTFWCGQVNGRAISPLPMPIDGSTFAATRIVDPDALPPVVIDCDMTPARPL